MKSTYKLRAECVEDLIKLFPFLAKNLISMSLDHLTFPNGYKMAEVFVTMTLTDIDLVKLKDLIRAIVDGHLMLQTVNIETLYTGKRDYNLE